MTITHPIYSLTTTELASMCGITPRRARQYSEDGLIQPLSPGRFDVGWFVHLRCGEKIFAKHQRRPDTSVLVAAGWLSGTGGQASDADKACLAGLFKRNGRSSEDALEALGEARALLRRSY